MIMIKRNENIIKILNINNHNNNNYHKQSYSFTNQFYLKALSTHKDLVVCRITFSAKNFEFVKMGKSVPAVFCKKKKSNFASKMQNFAS